MLLSDFHTISCRTPWSDSFLSLNESEEKLGKIRRNDLKKFYFSGWIFFLSEISLIYSLLEGAAVQVSVRRLSPPRPVFDHRSVRVEGMVDNLALGWGLFREFGFSFQCLTTNIPCQHLTTNIPCQCLTTIIPYQYLTTNIPCQYLTTNISNPFICHWLNSAIDSFIKCYFKNVTVLLNYVFQVHNFQEWMLWNEYGENAQNMKICSICLFVQIWTKSLSCLL
jgi:hypothetical protein